MKSMVRGNFLIFIALAVMLYGLNCGSRSENDRRAQNMGMGGRFGEGAEAVPVKVEIARRDTIADFILKTTTLEAERTVEVLAKTSGFVEELNVEEGTKVKKDQILTRLEDKQEQIELQEATVRLDNAKATLERSQKMVEDNLISKEDFEKNKFAYEQAKAQYDRAQLNFEYTRIRAPFSGTIIARNVEIGDMVRANVPIFKISDFSTLLARIYVPERDIRKITIGQAAKLMSDVISGRTFFGTVRLVNPAVDEQSGTVKVTIEIKDPKNLLQPGMFCSVEIVTEVHPNVIVIPKKALVLESEEDMVYINDNGAAKRRSVKIGLKDNLNLEILAGLEEGDEVITVGHEGLRDGSPVRDVAGEGADMAAKVSQEKARGQTETSMSLAAAEKSSPNPSTSGMEIPKQSAGSNPGTAPSRERAGRGGDLSNIPDDKIDDILTFVFARNPQAKEEYDKRVKDDPELKTNADKKRAFLVDISKQFRR